MKCLMALGLFSMLQIKVKLVKLCMLCAALTVSTVQAGELSIDKDTVKSSSVLSAPLSKAAYTDAQIIAFVSDAVVSVNTYNFQNISTWKREIQEYFTTKGSDEFNKALKKSENIEYVLSNRLALTSELSKYPQIIEQNVVNGRYTWKIEVPILLKYRGSGVSRNVSQLVTLRVQRAPVNEASNGFGVVQYVAR